MKKRCYPKYSYIIFFILAFLMLLFSMGPSIIKTEEGLEIKILFSSIMIFFSLMMTVGGILHLQYFYIEDNILYVKTLFGTITKLDLNNARAYIELLPTYFSWITSIDVKWICIYDNNLNILSKFKSGCSNKKNKKRIQIVFNEENIKIIERYIQIEKRKNI